MTPGIIGKYHPKSGILELDWPNGTHERVAQGDIWQIAADLERATPLDEGWRMIVGFADVAGPRVSSGIRFCFSAGIGDDIYERGRIVDLVKKVLPKVVIVELVEGP